MQIYCSCPEPREEKLVLAGSPVNPCYTVEYKGEIVQRHYMCAPQSMKDRLGCPCDCHLIANDKGDKLLSWCSFCPIPREEHK